MDKVDKEVLGVLALSETQGNILFLPKALERNLYEKVDRCLAALGGKWSRSKGGHLFEESPSDAIDGLLLTGECANRKKDFQFYPTPGRLAKLVCEMAEIDGGCDCLEPSAGRGNIAEEIKAYCPRSVTVVELDEKNAPFLQGKYDHCFVGQDFLAWQPGMLFDRIVMNPPFAKKQDIRHILRAFEFLKPGGALVAILSPSPFFCNDRLSQGFREFVRERCVEETEFGPGEFRESGTAIRTKCVKAVKPP